MIYSMKNSLNFKKIMLTLVSYALSYHPRVVLLPEDEALIFRQVGPLSSGCEVRTSWGLEVWGAAS